MDTNDSSRYIDLKARVEALGHRLINREHTEPGLYVIDPERSEFVITPTGHGIDDDLDEVEGWCDGRETPEQARAALHAATVREIEEEQRDATALEKRLLVAIRSSFSMTPDEELEVLARIQDALGQDEPVIVTFGAPPKGFELVARWLREIEAKAECMDLGPIVDHLRRGQYDLLLRIDAGVDEDEYTVAHGWTEKGVRYAWAELQVIGALRGYTDVVRPDAAKGGAA